VRRLKGDDGGCFAAALAAVRRFGGVLEHPEASHAWDAFGIVRPPREGGWVRSMFDGGWTCCVEQGHYGHAARKATWLYAVTPSQPPELRWGSSGPRARLDAGYHSREERARGGKQVGKRLTKRENTATPAAFRDLLLDIARLCQEGRRAV
jgi:hypothetical protein